MPNQLPKNQNQSNFNPLTSFRNEKHLNLIDSFNSIEKTQEDRVTNFILFITIILGIFTSLVTYLNLTGIKNTSLPQTTRENISYLKTKENTIAELNKEVEYLKRYKLANDSIKSKYSNFYNELNELINFLGKPPIQKIEFNNDGNNFFSFRVTLFLKEQSIENKLKDYASKSKRLKEIKIESIENIDESKEVKYTFTGGIDGR